MSDHTPGPWAVNFTKFSEVRAENGAVIARCLKPTSLTNLEANARRIVACVNACEGVSTKHLENNLPIRELVTRHNEVLREIEALKAERVGLVDDINALKDEIQSQRDKILGLASAQDSEDVFRIVEAMQLSAAHKAARVDCAGTAEDLV